MAFDLLIYNLFVLQKQMIFINKLLAISAILFFIIPSLFNVFDVPKSSFNVTLAWFLSNFFQSFFTFYINIHLAEPVCVFLFGKREKSDYQESLNHWFDVNSIDRIMRRKKWIKSGLYFFYNILKAAYFIHSIFLIVFYASLQSTINPFNVGQVVREN